MISFAFCSLFDDTLSSLWSDPSCQGSYFDAFESFPGKMDLTFSCNIYILSLIYHCFLHVLLDGIKAQGVGDTKNWDHFNASLKLIPPHEGRCHAHHRLINCGCPEVDSGLPKGDTWLSSVPSCIYTVFSFLRIYFMISFMG